MNNRDLSLDIVKAICIILMVVDHTRSPEYLNHFIYMFHMPCFFFASGWLLSENYLTDVRTGLKRKLKGSYWPFVKWELIFLLLHNVFVHMHFYTDSYSLKYFAERMLRTITMTGGESLLGGFWFLISLTWASMFTLLLFSVLNKHNKLTLLNISGGVFLILLIASLKCLIPIKLPTQFDEKTIQATAFYMSGFLFRRLNWEPNCIGVWGLIFYLIPMITGSFTFLDINVTGIMVFPFYVVAIFGSIATLFCSKALAKTCFAPILSYIGNKTLYILIFHFLAFKSITWILVKYYDYPIAEMSHILPPIMHHNSWIWIVYSILGIGLSLLAWELFHLACWKKFLIKRN